MNPFKPGQKAVTVGIVPGVPVTITKVDGGHVEFESDDPRFEVVPTDARWWHHGWFAAVEEPEPRYRVRVSTPRSKAYGGQVWEVAQPSDVDQDDRGALVIKAAARGAMNFRNGRRIPARGPAHVVYPRGEWTRVVITEIEERSS